MAKSKRTKKFEKNHLKGVLQRRKEFAKVKQSQQLKAKRQARRDEEGRGSKSNGDGSTNPGPPPTADKLRDMTVDDFFSGGFDIPAEATTNGKKTVAPVVGKRKRNLETTKDQNRIQESDDPVSDEEPEAPAEDHKQQLEELAKKDPEFYEYLKANDAELLDFEGNGDIIGIDELAGSEDEAVEEAQIVQGTKGGSARNNELTISLVKKWQLAMNEKKSLRSAKELVLAFRAAAHSNDEATSKHKYSLSNPEVYHEVIMSALKGIPEVIKHHIPLKEAKGSKIRLDTSSKGFRSLTPLLKSHAISVIHLLETLSDEGTIRQTLSSILLLLPYLLSFKKLLRNLTKTVVEIWSSASNKESSRIAAFLIMRRLVVIGDAGSKENVLKITYQGLVRGSRNTTTHTIQGINLMKNSAAELWILDPTIGYTTGYSFIRQLGIHLRSSITKNSNESYKLIYNWQYVHSLDFWSRVISLSCDSLQEATAGKESPLRPLIYPLVQVTHGAMRLIPTSTYFPLRFHLIRSLLRISSTTTTYIPLASALYEVLTSGELKKRPKQSTLKPLDFSLAIKAPKPYLRTRVYQDGIAEQLVELLTEFFVLYTKNIAFPELALPVMVMLKRWLKETGSGGGGGGGGGGSRAAAARGGQPPNPRLNAQLALVVQKLESNARWVEERRAKVEFAPENRAGVEGFLKEVEWERTPLGAFVVGQRKGREEKRRLIEEGRKEEERKRVEAREDEKMGGFEDDDEMEDGEDGEMGNEEAEGELDASTDEDADEDENGMSE
ncbi:MAG: hypothetical protein Q9165_006350 [Trypethelium subeluteriae]